MSAWGNIVKKAFPGNPKIKIGHPDIYIKTTTGAPTASTGKVGTLCWNSFDLEAYITTDGAGTWVKINA